MARFRPAVGRLLTGLSLVVLALCPSASARSALKVVHSPDALLLSGGEPIDSSSVADFLSLAMGYSLPKTFEWKAVKAITNVFSLPKASLTIRVRAQDVVNSSFIFPIIERSSLDSEFEILSERTRQRFGDHRLVVRMDSSKDPEVSIVGNVAQVSLVREQLKADGHLASSSDHLNLGDDTIRRYVSEINNMRQALDSMKRFEAMPSRTVFWFQVNHLPTIIESDHYAQPVKSEAKKLLSDLVAEAKRDLVALYGDRVIITVVEDDHLEHLVRQTRQADLTSREQEPRANYSALNLAHHFQAEFHAAFAMVAFTTLLIAVAVFGIAVAMWNLDPGKDSIIYRMTSQRIKKDQ